MVGSAKEQSKADKKAAKAELKTAKKAGESTGHSVPNGGSDGAPGPAERSAAAAEKQVALQRFRAVFALLMFLVAVATLLWTVKPWRYLSKQQRPNAAPASTVPDKP